MGFSPGSARLCRAQILHIALFLVKSTPPSRRCSRVIQQCAGLRSLLHLIGLRRRNQRFTGSNAPTAPGGRGGTWALAGGRLDRGGSVAEGDCDVRVPGDAERRDKPRLPRKGRPPGQWRRRGLGQGNRVSVHPLPLPPGYPAALSSLTASFSVSPTAPRSSYALWL